MNKSFELLKSLEGQQINNGPSPAGNWLSARLLEVKEGEVVVEVTVRKEMTNVYRTLHGGMFAFIADEVIGVAIYSAGNENQYVSINLTIDFLRPIQLGHAVKVHAYIVRKGRNIVNARCDFYNYEEELVSSASSNLMATNK